MNAENEAVKLSGRFASAMIERLADEKAPVDPKSG
jgi:hypothetical protein